jgi:hypothetical protein
MLKPFQLSFTTPEFLGHLAQRMMQFAIPSSRMNAPAAHDNHRLYACLNIAVPIQQHPARLPTM